MIDGSFDVLATQYDELSALGASPTRRSSSKRSSAPKASQRLPTSSAAIFDSATASENRDTIVERSWPRMQKLGPEFGSYGLEISRFYIENMSLPALNGDSNPYFHPMRSLRIGRFFALS